MMRPQIEHFVRDLSSDQAKALFKSSVGIVTVAISSYCNRQCAYCPNVIADRKTHRNFMSDALFFNIMRQLTTIDYSGKIYLHRYNEPLADRKYALSRIRDVRAFIPKASIEIFTNGDYLDRDYLDQLADLGVREVNSTVHAGPGGGTDIDSLIKEQDRRIADLDLPFELDGSAEEKCRIATAKLGGLRIAINAHDFYRGQEYGNAWAFDRGGVLSIPKTYVRKLPCLIQFTEMEIEWDGTLLPCCQINNDAVGHDGYVMGKLNESSDIFAAWTSTTYTQWRFRMSTHKKKPAPCSTCNYGEPIAPNKGLSQRLDDLHSLVARCTS